MRRVGILLIASLTACGGGGGSGLTLEEYAEQYNQAICEWLAACRFYADVASCRDSNPVHVEAVTAAIEQDRVAFHGDKAADCIDELRAKGCSYAEYIRGTPPVGSVCIEIFEGRVAMGGVCFEDIDCAGDYQCVLVVSTCNQDTTCCDARCGGERVLFVGENEDCRAQRTFCTEGLYCHGGPGGTATCVRQGGAVGAACQGAYGCVLPLLCSSLSGDGTCYQPAPGDGSCDPAQAVPWHCEPVYQVCDDVTMRCVDAPTEGEACFDYCIDGTNCDTLNQRCVAQPGLGESCQFTGDTCLGDLHCESPSITCVEDPARPACP